MYREGEGCIYCPGKGWVKSTLVSSFVVGFVVVGMGCCCLWAKHTHDVPAGLLIIWAISVTYAISLMAPATHACGCESSSLPCLGLCYAALNGFLNLFGEITVSQPAPETGKEKKNAQNLLGLVAVYDSDQ